MQKLIDLGLVLPPAVTQEVLESVNEVGIALAREQLSTSWVMILEILGYELGFRDSLSIEELGLLRDELGWKTAIRAKVTARFEELAMAEVETVRTLEDCAAVSKKIPSSGKARDLFNARHADIVTAELETLLTGPKNIDTGKRAYHLSHWGPPAMKGLVLRMFADVCQTLDECLLFLRVERFARTRGILESISYFDEVFERTLGLCRSREDVRKLRNVLFYDNYDRWLEKDRAAYEDRLQEAAALHTLALFETVKGHAGAMIFYHELCGNGPVSKRARKKFLALAVETANFGELRDILTSGPLDRYHGVDKNLREWGMARWEKMAAELVAATSDGHELGCLLENIPRGGSAWEECFRKYLTSISSAKEAYEFFVRLRNSGGEEVAARARYEELALAAIRGARTPSRIVEALKDCHDYPAAFREGVAKFAQFYQVPAEATA